MDEVVQQPARTGDSQPDVDMAQATVPPPAALLLRKRLGVSGEPVKVTKELKYYEKDTACVFSMFRMLLAVLIVCWAFGCVMAG